ncbi:MAG: Trk system potassium transporter TrkA [Synergistaceae bacterium]|jgi:trk system potassium uptake protein TrkA|nr:Trk system potassium transporter TrkA [Synergistaceae bacterium]
MKIIVVGAGEVGFTIAATLSAEGHDVNIVEQDEERAAKAEDELDARVIRGNGARPQVLYEAGVRDGCGVDFLIACTDRDEANILSCWIAKHAGVRRVVARARGLEFTDSPTWGKDLGIDMMISPERSVAREILELLSVSTAIHTAELLEGRAAIYAFRVAAKSPLAGLSLKEFRVRNPDLIAIVVYVERPDEEDIVPDGDTVFRENDLCYVVSYREQAWKLETLFQLHVSRPLKRVFIVGGGKLGFQVAQRLSTDFRGVEIRLIDRDREQCEKLAKELEHVLVLNGDGADEALLTEEGIDSADGYVCATESDEVNLIYCAIAKSMGARKCVAVVRRSLYLDMTNRMPVDAVVDPNEALASVILRHIRYPGHSKALSIIEKIDAEMLEIVMTEKHPLLGLSLEELNVPKGVLVALVARGRKNVFVPSGATRLEAGDHVILFASTAKMPAAAEFFG